MPTYFKGQVVRARGRDWIVDIPPEGDTDILIADPLFTDEERSRIERAARASEARRAVVPHGVYIQRSILCLEEIC